MRKLFGVFIASLFCFILFGTSYADQVDRTGGFNFNETTGLVNMPNARIQKYRTAKFYLRLSKIGLYPAIKSAADDPVEAGPATGTAFDSDFWFYNDGDRGLRLSPVRNVEVNFMNIRSQHLNPIVAVKGLVLEEQKYLPAVALGAHNIFSYTDDMEPIASNGVNSKPALFAVASKMVGPFDLTVGYGNGRFRNRIFYGAEAFFDSGRHLSALAEYDGNITSYGLKYNFPKDRWTLGMFIQDKTKFGAAFEYNMPW